MFATATAWMFGTKLGRTVTLAAVILLCWWAFSSHYEQEGYNRCQREHAAAVARANIDQARQNTANDKTSAGIGQKAATAADKTVAKAEQSNAKTKENIDRVYSKPPTTAPVVLGSCVHPLDDSVQDDIDRAVDRANATGSTLQATGGPYRTASAPQGRMDRVEAYARGFELGYGSVERSGAEVDRGRAEGRGGPSGAKKRGASLPGRS